MHVAPRMPAFLDCHPDVKVERVTNDAFVNLVGEGLDLAIRVGDLADPSAIARRIGTTRRVTVAASSYLDRGGVPSTPAERAHHDCAIYSGWRPIIAGTSRAVKDRCRLTCMTACAATIPRPCGRR